MAYRLVWLDLFGLRIFYWFGFGWYAGCVGRTLARLFGCLVFGGWWVVFVSACELGLVVADA